MSTVVTTGAQPSEPARYLATVALAAAESVSCGRSAVGAPTRAPAPVLWYSENRASFQENSVPAVVMSVHGAALTAALRIVSRTTTDATADASPSGCQGRPRLTVPAGASETIRLPVMRKPYLLPVFVLAAVTYPLFVFEPRVRERKVVRSNTAVAPPNT
nr:hypothetical protein [Pengzhenrongella sicca]